MCFGCDRQKWLLLVGIVSEMSFLSVGFCWCQKLNFFLVLESRKDNITKVSDKEPKTSQCHRIEGLPVP